MMEVSLKDNHCTLILFGKMFIFKQLISNRKLLSAVHWQIYTCPLIFRHNFTIKSARNCDRAVAESDSWDKSRICEIFSLREEW